MNDFLYEIYDEENYTEENGVGTFDIALPELREFADTLSIKHNVY